MRRLAQRGFTLVELMVVVVIIGMLSAVAIPAFIKYLAKSHTAEARTQVRKLYDGARVYYMEESQFPGTDGYTTGVTPALGTCCLTGDGARGQCLPDASLWTSEVWIALKFAVPDAHYYSYEYTTAKSAKQGASFFARAYGDLDCDGAFSTFSMYGEINSQYADGPAGTAAIYRESELE